MKGLWIDWNCQSEIIDDGAAKFGDGVALAIVAVMSGPVATAQTAYAAQSSNGTNVYVQPEVPRAPGVHMLDCIGTTGRMGCGPGWIWRDGWRGWACYPC